MTRIFLATVPGGGADLFVDRRLAEAEMAAFKAAEAAIAEERQRQALEAPTKPPTETPTRTVLGIIGAKASGFFW
jgi:hypothetical protein